MRAASRPSVRSAKSVADVGEPVDRAPLVADRAHDARAPDRIDDDARVVEIARHGLLEVDRERALERRDRDLAMQARRSEHEDGVGPPALEQGLPVPEALGAGRPGRPGQPRRDRDRRRTRPALRARSGSPDASPRSSRSRSGRSSCHHLAVAAVRRADARAPRFRPTRSRRVPRRASPASASRPARDPTPAGRRASPPRRRARRTAAGRQLDRQARVAQARRQHQRHPRSHAPGRPRRARRTATTAREPRCEWSEPMALSVPSSTPSQTASTCARGRSGGEITPIAAAGPA